VKHVSANWKARWLLPAGGVLPTQIESHGELKMAGANVLEITDGNFQTEVLSSDMPVLVDFWAPWCAPCRKIAPMIDELAAENLGAVKIGKVNIDDNQESAFKYGIEAIPTLLVFKGGQPVQRFQGIPAKARLQEALDAAKA
jgi:thioredoxin